MYLDSVVPPNLQIDVNKTMLSKLMKTAFKITQGNYLPSDLIVFDQAKDSLFEEILPYWGKFNFKIN